jgi:hypothetical protein
VYSQSTSGALAATSYLPDVVTITATVTPAAATQVLTVLPAALFFARSPIAAPPTEAILDPYYISTTVDASGWLLPTSGIQTEAVIAITVSSAGVVDTVILAIASAVDPSIGALSVASGFSYAGSFNDDRLPGYGNGQVSYMPDGVPLTPYPGLTLKVSPLNISTTRPTRYSSGFVERSTTSNLAISQHRPQFGGGVD